MGEKPPEQGGSVRADLAFVDLGEDRLVSAGLLGAPHRVQDARGNIRRACKARLLRRCMRDGEDVIINVPQVARQIVTPYANATGIAGISAFSRKKNCCFVQSLLRVAGMSEHNLTFKAGKNDTGIRVWDQNTHHIGLSVFTGRQQHR